MIPAEAVIAATKVLYADKMSNHSGDNAPQIIDACEVAVKKILEAAAPILLSHEREQTRLAHLDAMVNRGTASRLERAITGVLELAAPQRHMVSAAEIREWIARALEPTE